MTNLLNIKLKYSNFFFVPGKITPRKFKVIRSFASKVNKLVFEAIGIVFI